MIRVTLEISAPSREADPLNVASWLALAVSENPMDGMVIHRIEVEQEDT